VCSRSITHAEEPDEPGRLMEELEGVGAVPDVRAAASHRPGAAALVGAPGEGDGADVRGRPRRGLRSRRHPDEARRSQRQPIPLE
jgi:hypothetical protein